MGDQTSLELLRSNNGLDSGLPDAPNDSNSQRNLLAFIEISVQRAAIVSTELRWAHNPSRNPQRNLTQP